MDEAGTWHDGRPQPRRVCVRWGPSPLPQKGQSPSSLLRFEVENFEIEPKVGAISVIANFVALEPQIILVQTRNESVYKLRRYNRLNFGALALRVTYLLHVSDVTAHARSRD